MSGCQLRLHSLNWIVLVLLKRVNPVALEHMLRAVTRDLVYLKGLGINAIELLPAKEFPVTNHGTTTPFISLRSKTAMAAPLP